MTYDELKQSLERQMNGTALERRLAPIALFHLVDDPNEALLNLREERKKWTEEAGLYFDVIIEQIESGL